MFTEHSDEYIDATSQVGYKKSQTIYFFRLGEMPLAGNQSEPMFVTWLALNITSTIPGSSAVIVDLTNNSISVTGVSSERDIAYHHCNQVNG